MISSWSSISYSQYKNQMQQDIWPEKEERLGWKSFLPVSPYKRNVQQMFATGSEGFLYQIHPDKICKIIKVFLHLFLAVNWFGSSVSQKIGSCVTWQVTWLQNTVGVRVNSFEVTMLKIYSWCCWKPSSRWTIIQPMRNPSSLGQMRLTDSQYFWLRMTRSYKRLTDHCWLQN